MKATNLPYDDSPVRQAEVSDPATHIVVKIDIPIYAWGWIRWAIVYNEVVPIRCTHHGYVKDIKGPGHRRKRRTTNEKYTMLPYHRDLLPFK